MCEKRTATSPRKRDHLIRGSKTRRRTTLTAGLTIRERLAASDPANVGQQNT